MKTKIKFYHATIEDREQGKDVKCIEVNFPIENLTDIIDETYCGKMKKVVFIAMIGSDSKDYLITDDYINVETYFEFMDKKDAYFLFEEPTYEEAFAYCKDHCEIHELGLNP